MNSTSPHERSRTCPICGSVSSLVYDNLKDLFMQPPGDSERFSVYLCGSCGVAHTYPQITHEDFDRYYPSDYEAYERRVGFRQLLLHVKYRRDLKIIAGEASSGSSTMYEIGAGRAEFLKVAQEHGFEIAGTEPSDAGRQRALGEHGIVLENNDGENVAFSRSYDVVVLRHVLEHLSRPLSVLNTVLQKGMNPGGLLFLKVPNFQSWERERFEEYWQDLDIPRHLFHYSSSSVARLLAEVGFEHVRIRPEVIPTGIDGSLLYLSKHVPCDYPRRVYSLLPPVLRLPISQCWATLKRRNGPGRIIITAKKPARAAR